MALFIVNSSTQLSDLQLWFSENFPFLKIEFYQNQHGTGQGNSSNELIKDHHQLVSIKNNEENELIIFEDYSTNLVEHIFRTKLNLNVQVFRKNNDQWIQTTNTDNWTLKEQMDRAVFHTSN